MRPFINAVVTAIALVLLTMGAYAKPKTAKTTPATTQLHALAHVVTTEGHYYVPQMLALAQVVANRAYIYGDSANLRKVVYSPEMRGPINKKTPWVGSEAGRFWRTQQFLAGYMSPLVRGDVVAPGLKGAWHFDNRAHTDWGKFLGKYCDPAFKKGGCVWFYQSRNRKVTQKLLGREETPDPMQTASTQ